MAEISNRTLAALLVLAIVISLGGTIVSLNKIKTLQFFGTTGFATSDTGKVYLNVTPTASIRFAVNTTNFGTGYTKSGHNCTMYINKSNSTSAITRSKSTYCYGGWQSFDTSSEMPLILENDGNVYVNVTISSDKTASTFIGGSEPVAPEFQWKIANNESNSCKNDTGVPYDWTDVTTTDVVLCHNLSYISNENSMAIGLKVVIPYDTPNKGTQQSATITATATDIS